MSALLFGYNLPFLALSGQIAKQKGRERGVGGGGGRGGGETILIISRAKRYVFIFDREK